MRDAVGVSGVSVGISKEETDGLIFEISSILFSRRSGFVSAESRR